MTTSQPPVSPLSLPGNAAIEQQVQAAIAAIGARPALTHVFFVACGGSLAIMQPNKYVIDREAQGIRADIYNSNEFIHRNPRGLSENSVVILCSHSGTTPETVEAAAFARSRGALTVSLTHVADSPLAQASEHVVHYEHGPEILPSDSSSALLYRLVFGLLQTREQNPKYAALLRSLQALPAVIARVKEAHREQSIAWGRDYKRETLIYTMASGANYGVAYSFAICLLQEMQWIHSQAIHAGEYFHGPFEITDDDVPFILLLGLDETRPLEERALAFAQKFSQRLLVLDAKTFDLTGFDPEMSGYLTPLVFSPLLRQYVDRLAEERGHPLSVRRYMWKMDY
ncbi:fructoselysine 6-phosphate deglycase [Deinobacterium chartae]|uniref:Fructoselysine 6-phosphate deglycase n=1 Tax=Deinobacterium chartae TaxID=521158 RepID=A0A841I204_9DEIO|nr:SIS domain-containing protein [Deinobacterium chartae]MBB6098358.1 fructoselysine 6-phosphate deglycase [Deinobacterium chartae]